MPGLIFEADEVFQSEAWKQKMSAYGKALKNNNVSEILLVHGTFAGDDALGLFDLLEPLNKRLSNALKQRGKAVLNRVVKDVGNYTPEYARALAQALDINCELLVWSSGNYHLARFQGTLKLAEDLAKKITENKIQNQQRILLLGHSHAGQLFALLTSFLANDERAQKLYTLMEKNHQLKENKLKLFDHLAIIKQGKLDFVTFGTPVRYCWGEYDNYRLMAVVNHRSNRRLSGVLSTRDGDYVQQWGGAGTDALPPKSVRFNDEFDAVLDKGRDRRLLIANIKSQKTSDPVYATGNSVTKTLRVNYKDNAVFPVYFLNPFSIPHSIKTLFGHGVYTKKSVMLFNMKMIVNHWYG